VSRSDVQKGFDLDGKVALVTGGSRGLGRAAVLGLAQAGADVIIASRSLESCEETAAVVEQETGRRALPVACHVGRWDELDSLVDRSYGEFGKVDVLVNNVGMSPLYDEVTDITEALWRKVIDVNLTSSFRLTASIGTRMAAGAGGSIINISSVAAIKPTPETIPYAAAKAGVNAITVAFAHAFGPSVRVNCIMPGTFLTDVSDHWDMKAFEARAQSFALKRGAEPEEIVGAILYFAGSASSYTTGSWLRVDGGYV
jgi:NAD(P)-dependent dehydrogenase (short-subunit alcohol dehydrogenase family)